MDHELDHFKRAVNLTELAVSLGYRLDASARFARGSVAMRNEATDDKVIIRRDVDGHWTYFSVRDDRDNGSVIDFLQRRRALTLAGVRKELRSWLHEDRPRPAPSLYRPGLAASSRDEAAVARSYAAAAHGDNPYLLSRGLRRETLRDPRFAGTYRSDRRGNVLFPHLDPRDTTRVVGYEVKNSSFTSFASGGRKTFWISGLRPDDNRLVIVEGVIDALSYHQLFPDPRTRYLSTAGSVGSPQLALVAEAIASIRNPTEVVVATDSDPAGEKLHRLIQEAAGTIRLNRHASPVPKDWNDYLRALDRERSPHQPRRLER